MQIIFGEKCVSLLRLFFAAVLMLWCAQTAAYSGQCHTTQGNPYIGVNFGVKTLEEEENTAGVVKDKFYQWNESNDYYVSCDCDKDNVRNGRWAFAADSPLVYLGDNWYKINDYLAAKVLLQVKGSSPTAVPFENVGTGGDTRWHICIRLCSFLVQRIAAGNDKRCGGVRLEKVAVILFQFIQDRLFPGLSCIRVNGLIRGEPCIAGHFIACGL